MIATLLTMSPSFLLSFLPSPPKEGSDSVCVLSVFFSAKAVSSEISPLEGTEARRSQSGMYLRRWVAEEVTVSVVVGVGENMERISADDDGSGDVVLCMWVTLTVGHNVPPLPDFPKRYWAHWIHIINEDTLRNAINHLILSSAFSDSQLKEKMSGSQKMKGR